MVVDEKKSNTYGDLDLVQTAPSVKLSTKRYAFVFHQECTCITINFDNVILDCCFYLFTFHLRNYLL